ncbi:MAG: hypothetical protein R6U51_01090 [Anaerolineales bacterium]
MTRGKFNFLAAALILIPFFSLPAPRHVDFPGVPSEHTYQFRDTPNDAQSQNDRISRVEVLGQYSYTIIEQPKDNPAFVSHKPGTFTHFLLAERYGAIGLMAHNAQVGSLFSEFEVGTQVTLFRQDQKPIRYQVQSIRKFKALSPNSAYSAFIDLKDSAHYTAGELFLEIYGVGDRLVFQTCLSKDGLNNWGRWFVIAYPVGDDLLFESYLPTFQRPPLFQTPIQR